MVMKSFLTRDDKISGVKPFFRVQIVVVKSIVSVVTIFYHPMMCMHVQPSVQF